MEQSIGSSQPYVTLNNGTKIPQIGLGTYDSAEGEIDQVLKSAILEHGYRHIDTAKVYQNEEQIGNVLEQVMKEGVKREELYIVTKLWRDDYDDIEGAIRTSLKKLKLDYLDLYLLHWPIPTIDWEDKEMPFKGKSIQQVWQDMEKLVEKGLTKSIGVSNMLVPQLMDLFTYAKIRPVTNQIELHPYLVQKELVTFCQRYGVTVTGFAPLGAFAWPFKRPEHKDLNVLKEPVVQDLAKKYDRSVGQVILNWHLHRGHIIIPKTSKVERLRENIQVYDFKMTDEEYDSITALDKRARFYDPETQKDYGWNNMYYFH